MDYVNTPIGKGKKPSSPLLPLIAIPTTSGSGSEATTVAVLDIPELKLKTGISHRFLRPTLALVDPELSKTTPAGVTASAGLDVICHAIESYISKPYFSRNRPLTPADRPPYQGSNPISDIWSLQAIEYAGKYFLRSVLGDQFVSLTRPSRAGLAIFHSPESLSVFRGNPAHHPHCSYRS